jgi:hypothetical protein
MFCKIKQYTLKKNITPGFFYIGTTIKPESGSNIRLIYLHLPVKKLLKY